MKLDEYRQRFRDYTAARASAELRRAQGRADGGPQADEILREHSDLFTREAIAELQAALEDRNPGWETERTAIGRLSAFAGRGFLELATREIAAEIEAWAGGSRIELDGEQLSLDVIVERLSGEADPGKRRELWARVADLRRRMEDLFIEQERIRQEAARKLGYDNHLAYIVAPDRLDAVRLAEKAGAFLSRTDRVYDVQSPPVFRSEAGVGRNEAIEADLPRIERLARFDRWRTNARLSTVYQELFTGFGFRHDQQTNVSVDLDADGRPGWRAGCFAINVPEDIRLRLRPVGDPTDYGRLLETAARVQHFAWTSAQLRPELRLPGDAGLGAGWAALFGSLECEPGWLIETFGFVEHEEYRKTLAIADLMRVRRDAAQLRFEVELYAERLTGAAGQRHAELLGEALGVRVEQSSCWLEAGAPLESANRLRGRAFAWQLREYLKTRHGHNWWRARKAGEMIIDIWNTGHRYTVEELARLLGLGELDFDGLADEMIGTC